MTNFRSSLFAAAALVAALGVSTVARADEARAPFTYGTVDASSGVGSPGVPLGDAPTAEASRQLPALSSLWSPTDAGARGVVARTVAQNDGATITR